MTCLCKEQDHIHMLVKLMGVSSQGFTTFRKVELQRSYNINFCMHVETVEKSSPSQKACSQGLVVLALCICEQSAAKSACRECQGGQELELQLTKSFSR